MPRLVSSCLSEPEYTSRRGRTYMFVAQSDCPSRPIVSIRCHPANHRILVSRGSGMRSLSCSHFLTLFRSSMLSRTSVMVRPAPLTGLLVLLKLNIRALQVFMKSIMSRLEVFCFEELRSASKDCRLDFLLFRDLFLGPGSVDAGTMAFGVVRSRCRSSAA